MTVGRTSDARLRLDTGTALMRLTNVLGLTIAGEGNITRQPYLEQTYEQASIHSAGGGINFSTIYQTAEFEALAQIAASNPRLSTELAIICPPAPTSWHIIPVSWPRASYDAPADDAITRPWSLMRRGLGWVGTRVDSFDLSATAPATIGGDLDAGLAFVVLDQIGSRTGFQTSGANITGHINLSGGSMRTGIFGPLTVSGADRDLRATIAGPSGNVSGWVLSLGTAEERPDG